MFVPTISEGFSPSWRPLGRLVEEPKSHQPEQVVEAVHSMLDPTQGDNRSEGRHNFQRTDFRDPLPLVEAGPVLCQSCG